MKQSVVGFFLLLFVFSGCASGVQGTRHSEWATSLSETFPGGLEVQTIPKVELSDDVVEMARALVQREGKLLAGFPGTWFRGEMAPEGQENTGKGRLEIHLRTAVQGEFLSAHVVAVLEDPETGVGLWSVSVEETYGADEGDELRSSMENTFSADVGPYVGPFRALIRQALEALAREGRMDVQSFSRRMTSIASQ